MPDFALLGTGIVEIHYLYLLVDRDHHRFKIGVSVDPRRRARTQLQNFSLYMSLQVGLSRERAYATERALHQMFEDMNIAEHEMGHVDGKTEWFSFDAYPACRGYVCSLVGLTPVTRVSEKRLMRKSWFDQCMELLKAQAGTNAFVPVAYVDLA